MAQHDGTITLSTKVDTTGIEKAQGNIKAACGGLMSSFKGLAAAAGIAFGVGALINFGKQAIELASDIEEVQNVVDVAFGSMTYKMEQFANTAIETYGLSKLTAKRTGSTYMAMAKGMGIADEAASEMALTLTGLSADMASFYNIDQKMTDIALKSVFTGETETLKQYGIVMTQVNLEEYARQQGITKSIKKMTQQEQVMLRYQYIMQQTALAQGDFARTQDSWANQTRILSERWREMQATFGEAFKTIAAFALPAINTLINGLNVVAGYAVKAAQAIAAVFGKKITTETKAVSSGMNNIASSSGAAADNADKIGKASKNAAKETDKMVASFDELNILSDGASKNNASDSGSGSAGNLGGGISAGEIETPVAAEDLIEFEAFEGVIERIKGALGGLSKIDLSKATKEIEKFKEPLKSIAATAFDNLIFGIENVFVPLANFSANEVLPRLLQSINIGLQGFDKIYSGCSQLLQSFVTNFLTPIAQFSAPLFLELWDGINLKLQEFIILVQGSAIFDDLNTIFNSLYKILGPVIEAFTLLLTTLLEIISSNVLVDLEFVFKNLEAAIGFVADLLRGDFSGAWEHFKDLMIDNKIDFAKEKLNLLKGKFNEVITVIGTWINTWKTKVAEFVSTWVENVQNWWDSNVLPWFTADKWDNLFNQIGVSIGLAVAVFVRVWNSGIATWWDDNVVGWFSADTWKDVLKNIITALSNFFTDDDGFVKTWVKKIKSWWDDEVVKWFSVNTWQEELKNVITAISNFFTGETGFIQTWKTNIETWWNDNVLKWFKKEEWEKLGGNIKDGIVNGLKGIVQKIGGFINSIITNFQNMANGAIGAVNKIIDGYNKVAGVVPGMSVVGRIAEIDLSRYKIPGCARGAVIPPNREFLAVLGDQKHGTNIEAPLATIEEAVRKVLSESSYGSDGDLTVNCVFDDRVFGQIVVKSYDKEKARKGRSFISKNVVFG